jgi:hypothetical protein
MYVYKSDRFVQNVYPTEKVLGFLREAAFLGLQDKLPDSSSGAEGGILGD